MNCQKCGHELPENAKFCLNCGNAVNEVIKIEPVQSGVATIEDFIRLPLKEQMRELSKLTPEQLKELWPQVPPQYRFTLISNFVNYIPYLDYEVPLNCPSCSSELIEKVSGVVKKGRSAGTSSGNVKGVGLGLGVGGLGIGGSIGKMSSSTNSASYLANELSEPSPWFPDQIKSWETLFYCHKCDSVFSPISKNYVPSSKVKLLLNQEAYLITEERKRLAELRRQQRGVNETPFLQRSWVIIACYLFCFPVGILLSWLCPTWTKKSKIVATVASISLYLFYQYSTHFLK